MPTPQTLLNMSGKGHTRRAAGGPGTPCGATALHILQAPAGFTLDGKTQGCHFLLPRSDSEKTHVCLPCYGRLSSLGQQSPCHRQWLTSQCHTLPPGARTLQPAPSPGSQVVRLPLLWTRGHLLPRWLWDHSPQRPPNQPSETRDLSRFSWELFPQVMTELRTYKSHVFVYPQVPPFPAAHPREESTVRTGDGCNVSINPKGRRVNSPRNAALTNASPLSCA